MKRILHVFANLDLGGAESRIMDVYRSINKEKYQFDFLILTSKSCFFEDEVVSLGGRVYKVTHPSISLYKHTKEVLLILNNNNFSAIHSHTSYFSGLIMLIAWLCKVPYRVAHARNQLIGTKNIMTKSFFWIGKALCNLFATSKLAISKDAGVFLFGRNADVTVVPNSFEYGEIKFHSLISILELSEDTINIVMVARLVPVKNHIFAIMLVKKINENRDRAKKVKLYLIGSGSEEKRLTEIVESLDLNESVVFYGMREDVHDVLCEFDFLILPSFSEGLGVAALEGQAAGIPCILSDGVPEEADLGLGLVKRLPLDLKLWENMISDLKCRQNLTKELINKTFSEKGYSVKKTSEVYLSKYGIEI